MQILLQAVRLRVKATECRTDTVQTRRSRRTIYAPANTAGIRAGSCQIILADTLPVVAGVRSTDFAAESRIAVAPVPASAAVFLIGKAIDTRAIAHMEIGPVPALAVRDKDGATLLMLCRCWT